MRDQHGLLIWADANQTALIQDAVKTCGAPVVGIGSPDAEDGRALAEALDAAFVSDLRHSLHAAHNTLLWVASSQPLDESELRAIHDTRTETASCEPDLLLALCAMNDGKLPGTVHFIPRFRRTAGYLGALTVFEESGPPAAASLVFESEEPHGSLHARFYDALDTLVSVCGMPETVSGTLHPKQSGSAGPQHAHHLVAHLRFESHRCASIMLSRAARRWSRQAIFLGEHGSLQVSEQTFDVTGQDETRTDDAPPAPTAGHVYGTQLDRVMQDLDSQAPTADPVMINALCEAVYLSDRTGQAESPQRLLDMRRRL
jgi:predicted dehydrogenase